MHKIKKSALIAFLLTVCLLCCVCALAAAGPKAALPALHTIPADPALGTPEDDDGAETFRNELNHADSAYYKINDYYNMQSGGSLHILSHFDTYQQTTEYSCACSSALMVLNHYGITDYDELEICSPAKTDTSKGTSVEGLASFLEGIGLDTCGTDSPYDDVLIMADSCDITDHYQDGYYVVPFARFFDMWREGPCAEKDVPYEQPFVVAFRPAA